MLLWLLTYLPLVSLVNSMSRLFMLISFVVATALFHSCYPEFPYLIFPPRFSPIRPHSVRTILLYATLEI